MDIKIEITNQPVLDMFNRMIATGQDMHPMLDAIGATMEEKVRNRFETKTDPDGVPWALWKPSTAKSYPKDGHGKVLDRYGDMLGSLSYQVDGDSVLWGFGAVAGDGFPYPAAHEFSTVHMERRGMLTADPVAGTLGADDEQAILDVLRNTLENTLKG